MEKETFFVSTLCYPEKMQRVAQITAVVLLIVLVILLKPGFEGGDPVGRYQLLYGSYLLREEAVEQQQQLTAAGVESHLVELNFRDGGRMRTGYRLVSATVVGQQHAEAMAERLQEQGVRTRVVREGPTPPSSH